MPTRTMLRLLLAPFVLSANALAAQSNAAPASAIPVMQLSAPEGMTTEPLKYAYGVVQLAGGRVLLNDPLGKRLILFAPNLATFTISADSDGTGASHYPSTFRSRRCFTIWATACCSPTARRKRSSSLGPMESWAEPWRTRSHTTWSR